jgi:hypothetical protein
MIVIFLNTHNGKFPNFKDEKLMNIEIFRLEIFVESKIECLSF